MLVVDSADAPAADAAAAAAAPAALDWTGFTDCLALCARLRYRSLVEGKFLTPAESAAAFARNVLGPSAPSPPPPHPPTPHTSGVDAVCEPTARAVPALSS